MTPLEHNKYVGLSHLAYGVIHILMTGVSMLLLGAMFSSMRFPDASGRGFPPQFLVVFMIVALIINVILSIPSFIAGYALLKRKPWAKVMGIVAAVFAAMRIPFGTAVSVYTFWFLFSEPGKTVYGNPSQTLPPPPPTNWVL